MNLLFYFNFLKEQTTYRKAYVSLKYLPDNTKLIKYSEKIEILKNAEVNIFLVIEGEQFNFSYITDYFLGSEYFFKDGVDNCSTFLEFIDFIEGTRCGYKEYNNLD
jgi:hypothetical protein